MRGQVNPAYDDVGEGTVTKINVRAVSPVTNGIPISTITKSAKEELVALEEQQSEEERAKWGHGLEFLMSCIAMSVGLGNIWRFPFTAYENGGGAFLIPYIIVLIVIGRPLYYMEMVLGQFSARGNVKMFKELAPALVGIGYGQLVPTICVATYYSSLMAITLFYLYSSFAADLPWSKCRPEWGDICFDSGEGGTHTNATNRMSSSELFFTKFLLQERSDISDGIGAPDWRLTICLFLAWCAVFFVAMRGVKSSGKAAYFLALFPYVVMIALLIRAVTLPGAGQGIIFFIKPEWEKLLSPDVWYAAVTQAFFSLNVGFGTIIMYSSYNDFNHNINRDALIVTSIDTFTSLLAGSTIFGILGNLAYVSDIPIDKVVKGGTGLAFVSYPDAIAKFDWCPQLFAVLFFLMLFTLGIGSLVALQGCVITVIKDQFQWLKYWQVAGGTVIIGFCISLIYVTPGGQAVLNLVDYFGGTFIVFVLTIFEIAAVSWIYGLNNISLDIEYMLNIKPGIYWRICWAVLAPGLLIIILIYFLITAKQVTYQDIFYPKSALAVGWLILIVGILQIPLWGLWTVCRKREEPEIVYKSFKPSKKWGPKSPLKNKEWRDYKAKAHEERTLRGESKLKYLGNILIGR